MKRIFVFTVRCENYYSIPRFMLGKSNIVIIGVKFSMSMAVVFILSIVKNDSEHCDKTK